MKVDYQFIGKQNAYVVTLYEEGEDPPAWEVSLLQLFSLRFASATIAPTPWHRRTREATQEWTAYLGEGEMLSATRGGRSSDFQGIVFQARQHRIEVVRATKNCQVHIERIAHAVRTGTRER